MLHIYFKTAWRSLWKNKFFTVINLLGLSVAMAAFLLLMSYVKFERSYEEPHANADNIYRLTLDLFKGSEYLVTDCETYPPMGPEFKNRFPEVKNYVRLQFMGDCEMTAADKAFITTKFYAADPSVFTVFNFPFIKGDSKTALSSPDQAVITSDIARRFFGNDEALGKKIKLKGMDVVVTGVVKNMPPNTHMKFDVLVPFTTIERLGFKQDSWNANNNFTYLLMQPGTDLAVFNAKLKDFSKQRLKGEIVTAEPIKTIHLQSHKTFEPDVNGDSRTVNFLLVIAFLVILISSANYVNLTTARSVEKMKEASLRKILGSSRASLIKLFFLESFIINILSVICALLLIQLVMPVYKSLVGDAVTKTIFTSASFWIMTALLFVMNTLLSGIYPAFILSHVKTIAATTRNFTGSLKGHFVRRVLVVGQFTIALVVLSAAVIIYQQLYFIRHQDLGMNIDQVLIVKGPQALGSDSARQQLGTAFKNELMQLPGVEKVSCAASLPGLDLNSLNTNIDILRYGQTVPTGTNYYIYGIDEDFISVLDMKLAAGENFTKLVAENKDKLIINEEAARLLGFESAAAAIGQKIRMGTNTKNYLTIIGVIKNYHQQSLKVSQLPMIHWYEKDITNYYAIKLHNADPQKSIAAIAQIWKTDFSGHMFDYYFMDDMFNQLYKADVQFGKIVNIFSLFTLFITCLGLLGLTAYNVSKRGKEISIRKVLGASSKGIVTLLAKDFMKLVAVAVLLSIPLCWFTMNKWLQNFAYRIHISWWVFVLTGILTIVIAFLAISLQAVKADIAKPIDSLRAE